MNWKRAKAEGIYHVCYFVRCYADSKKMKIRDCAYWPETHEFKRDGETMGPMVPTTLSKVEQLLSKSSYRFMWYQDTLNLFDTMIVGPFDFGEHFSGTGCSVDNTVEGCQRVSNLRWLGEQNHTIGKT